MKLMTKQINEIVDDEVREYAGVKLTKHDDSLPNQGPYQICAHGADCGGVQH